MALPDPKTLDIAYLQTGPFCYEAASTSVTTNTLDYAYLKTGPFVAYQPVAPVGGTNANFLMFMGA